MALIQNCITVLDIVSNLLHIIEDIGEYQVFDSLWICLGYLVNGPVLMQMDESLLGKYNIHQYFNE